MDFDYDDNDSAILFDELNIKSRPNNSVASKKWLKPNRKRKVTRCIEVDRMS